MIQILNRVPVRKSNRGFTLMEVMVVVAIAGAIMVSAMAPMVYTVELLRNLQRDYAKTNRERFAVERIFHDVRTVIPTSFAPSFQVRKGNALLLWAYAPTFERLPAGCVVFAVVQEGKVPQGKNGLYRWILPLEKSIKDVDLEKLDPAKGLLILSGIEEAVFSVWSKDIWVEEYEGGLPVAMDLRLKGKGRVISRVDWLPNI